MTDGFGDVVNLEGNNCHREIGRQHRGGVEHLFLETFALNFAFSCNKNSADGEYGESVDYIEHGSIEYGFMTKDGGYNRVTHEAYVAKHQSKAKNTLIVFLLRQVSREYECDAS